MSLMETARANRLLSDRDFRKLDYVRRMGNEAVRGPVREADARAMLLVAERSIRGLFLTA